jgi:hypothetical protein
MEKAETIHVFVGKTTYHTLLHTLIPKISTKAIRNILMESKNLPNNLLNVADQKKRRLVAKLTKQRY